MMSNCKSRRKCKQLNMDSVDRRAPCKECKRNYPDRFIPIDEVSE